MLRAPIRSALIATALCLVVGPAGAADLVITGGVGVGEGVAAGDTRLSADVGGLARVADRVLVGGTLIIGLEGRNGGCGNSAGSAGPDAIVSQADGAISEACVESVSALAGVVGGDVPLGDDRLRLVGLAGGGPAYVVRHSGGTRSGDAIGGLLLGHVGLHLGAVPALGGAWRLGLAGRVESLDLAEPGLWAGVVVAVDVLDL
jgi:hypothetical protein